MNQPDVMKGNVSVKKYSQKPVEEAHFKYLSSAIRSCSSMDNRQPWKVVAVRDEQLKKSIAGACGNGKQFMEAPVILVLCAFPDDAYPTLGGFINSFSVDAGVLMERISAAARQMGLQTEWAFVFKEEKIREIIRAPDYARIVSLTPLGIPDEVVPLPPARQPQELLTFDHF
ncbi:MAG: nitroreductase family protein [Methanomassiliicoccales archaeon]